MSQMSSESSQSTQKKVAHLLYCPFTGLGMYGGYRGKRWLRNRIKIFKQFVVPSLKTQTNQNYILWVSWRYEDRNNPLVQEFKTWLECEIPPVVFTYAGVCFWDDKYPDDVAFNRLIDSVHGSLGELLNYIGEAEEILMTIQPSDDCYDIHAVEEIQKTFRDNPDFQALGFKKGYVMNYLTKEIREWNPKTNPPFFTIRFPRKIFEDPRAHVEYTGPYKSHEYIGDKLKYATFNEQRGFIVGTHGENISTVFNHPFAGEKVNISVLKEFGLDNVSPLEIKISLRKIIMRKLPVGWQKKLRYLFGEKFFNKFYEFIRS